MASYDCIPDLDVEEQLFGGVIYGSPDEYQGLLASLKCIDVKNGSQRTLLHMAARVGKFGWVESLLEMGADPFIQDKSNATVLEVAEELGAKYPEHENRKNILRILRFVQARETAKQASSNASEAALGRDDSIGPQQRVEQGLPEVLSTVSRISKEVSSINDLIGKLRQEMMAEKDTLLQNISQVVTPQMDVMFQHVNRELTSQKDDVVNNIKQEVTSQIDALSQKVSQEITLQKDVIINSVSQEVTSQLDDLLQKVSGEVALQKDAISQDFILVKEVVEDLRTSMSGAINEVAVGLSSRDTLLEALEVSVTSLVQEWQPLKKPLHEMSMKVAEAKGGLEGVSESHLGNIPSISTMSEERISNHCIETMLGRTEFFKRNDDFIALARSFYLKLYSMSPITSCLLKYLQHQPEFYIVMDCESQYIGRIKANFRDFAGRECSGQLNYKFVDFKGKALYLGVKVDCNREVKWPLGHLAMSLAQLSVLLAFKNEGKPYVNGDAEKAAQYKIALEEAKEVWGEEYGIDRFFGVLVKSENQLEREVCMISVIPAMVAFYGTADGTLRARRKMSALTRFYEDHVMPRLLRDDEESH